jgi:hypothetical protein
LFCDNLSLYKASTAQSRSYPFNVLFSEASTGTDLQKIIDSKSIDTRLKILAYHKQRTIGFNPKKTELLGVIVEVGMDEGLDVLAAFNDGTARYINHTGKLLVWETKTDTKAKDLTTTLLAKSLQIVNQIGPWDKPRKPHPSKGDTRITFLVSDRLYFGEGPTETFFSDELASPALTAATYLMQFLIEKGLEYSPHR